MLGKVRYVEGNCKVKIDCIYCRERGINCS